ncbi:bifunctional DNA primase/polymerase [Nocardia fluminea]|uniref:bifunctional DNA primase/polymerase n=1 Tax=Nocardia fluminea TaxID=134984 RepID=UPI00366FFDEB
MSVGHESSPEALLSAALDYAETGLRVHPLAPSGVGGKAPFTRWQDVATTDPDTIRRWWDRCPDANIGVIVPAGHIVLDVDLYKPGTLDRFAELEARLGQLPPTLTCVTGGGGAHLWFTVPDLTFRKPCDGIDLRCAGKNYVVMPPSVHANGTPYVWRDETMPAAALPPAWVDDLASTRTTSATRTPGLPNPNVVGVTAWLEALPSGGPDKAMRTALRARTLDKDMRAAAHDTARDRIMHVLSLGAEGHPGAAGAVAMILGAFLREFERRRALGLARAESQEFAMDEFMRLIAGAVGRIVGAQ